MKFDPNGEKKLEIIYSLMKMYAEGTGKPLDFKKEDKYEIISFINKTIPLLNHIGVKEKYPKSFVEEFFNLLFSFKPKEQA